MDKDSTTLATDLRQTGKKPGTIRRRLLRFLAYFALIFVLLTWLPILALNWLNPPVTAFMVLHNQVSLERTQYTWVERRLLGEECALAVIAAEDQNFAQHQGLDLSAIAKAVEEKQDGGRLRGASTISQQLVKNLFLWSGRSFMRKALEAYLAVVIDLLLPKKRILELYLNIVELGPGIYGVPAASMHFFGVKPAAINASQAALLAAVLPNPNRFSVANPSAYVRQRQIWIHDQAARLRRNAWLEDIGWDR